jgi:hypothetical protein
MLVRLPSPTGKNAKPAPVRSTPIKKVVNDDRDQWEEF